MIILYEEVFMLAVITSDLHGRLEILRRLVIEYPDADLFLDAGDSGRKPAELDPFISVKGNCDIYGFERFRVITFGDERIYLFHGDRADLSDEALYARALRHRCKIIVHGHTHVPRYHCYRGVRIICPGSPAYPRGGSAATYVVLRGKSAAKVEFVMVDYEKS